jgi:hypothetical protein
MEETGKEGHPMGRLAIVLLAVSVFMGGEALAQPFGMASSQAQAAPEYKVLCSATGRYVFGQISGSSKDQFMLDTQTGRLWQIAESGEIGIYLRTVPYRDAEGTCSPLPESVSGCVPKEKAEK